MIRHAGDLRHLISIVKVAAVKDAEGNMLLTDAPVCACWAAVKDLVQREAYEANARQLEETVAFTVRWRAGIAPGMYVIFGGARHEIKQVDEMDHRRDFMTLNTVRKAVTA